MWVGGTVLLQIRMFSTKVREIFIILSFLVVSYGTVLIVIFPWTLRVCAGGGGVGESVAVIAAGQIK